MKYMLLIYGDPALEPPKGSADWDTMMAEFFALGERMQDRATVLAGEELAAPAHATLLRRPAGKVVVTDGPFAATRDPLGGFFLIECAALDDALAFAAEIPTARWGAVEIRPVEDPA